MKYRIRKDLKKEVGGKVLYRIEALRDFANVKKGDLGGWVESEDNLSQEGNCWIYDDACVYGYAHVTDDACVYDNAEVYGDAEVYGNAKVYNNAEVSGNTKIYGNAEVFENAKIYGSAEVFGNAEICGNASVYDSAEVCDNARVYGYAGVGGNAEIKEYWTVGSGYVFYPCPENEKEQIKYLLAIQLGIYPIEDYVILYKRVNKIKDGKYCSLYDKNFIYELGKIAEVENPDISNAPCSTGIHLSTPTYWEEGDTLIACKVMLDDIITVQRGKVRCRKCLPLQKIKMFSE